MNTISTANGYNSNVKTVSVWESVAAEEADLPEILIRDTSDSMPADGVGQARLDHELSVELSAALDGKTSVADARNLVADIVKAIGTDYTFGGLAFDTIVNSADLIADDANKVVAFAMVDITVRYRSTKWTI